MYSFVFLFHHLFYTKNQRSKLYAIILTLLSVILSCKIQNAPERDPAPNNSLVWHFLEVGQGNAACGSTDNSGSYTCVDLGPPKSRLVELMDSLGIKKIETLFLTHEDLDHSGGLTLLPRRLWPEKLLVGPGFFSRRSSSTSGAVQKIFQITDSLLVDSLWAGKKVNIKNQEYRCLWPLQKSSNSIMDLASNQRSLVLLVTKNQELLKNQNLKSKSFLFTADIDSLAESQLLDYWKQNSDLFNSQLDLSVLFLPHHGSRFSSSTPFLRALRSDWVVISSRYDIYGHPHAETLDRLKQFGFPESSWIFLEAQGSWTWREN